MDEQCAGEEQGIIFTIRIRRNLRARSYVDIFGIPQSTKGRLFTP
jgi:hypothetical protein